MKKNISIIVLSFFFLFTGNFAFAQVLPAPAPLDKETIDCERTGTYIRELEKKMCYSVAKYKTKDAAVARHREILATLIGCNACPLPKLFTCSPTLGTITLGNLHLNEAGTKWCTSTSLRFSWTCDECTAAAPFPNGAEKSILEEIPGDSFEDREEANLAEEHQNNQERSSLKEVAIDDSQWSVFPNPTSGQIELEINTSESVRAVKLIARNIAGQIVYEQNLGATARGDFSSQADLSALDNGWYMLSLYLDEELLGTEKIVISK